MLPKRKVVLVGWDAADWQLIHPLMDRGRMPNLQRLVENGCSGNLQTLTPALSPMLWTSIATGRNAADHGILGFFEPDPNSGTVRPSSSTSRRVSAIWNILDQQGLSACAVNWMASHPAEPGRGTIVSNALPTIAGSVLEPPKHIPAGAVHPAAETRTFADLMVLPSDLSGNDLALFIPALAKVDQQKDKRPLELAKLMAQAFTTHAAATWILENAAWDFVGIYYDFIDRAGHLFMPFHPPRMEGASDEDFEIYQHVIPGVYECHDLLLGRLLQLAGPDVTVMLISDHGFRSGELRPTAKVGPEAWHRDHGVFCISGPGIRKDELVFGATLLDITPTLLTLYGLPVAEDMPGRALVEIYEEPPALVRVPTYETADRQRNAVEVLGESWDAAAMMDQLAALGYVDSRTDDQKQRAESIRVDQSFNLARALLGAGQAQEAIPILESLRKEKPGLRNGLALSLAYVRAGRIDDARSLVADFDASPTAEDRPLADLLRAEIEIAAGNGEAALPYLESVRQSTANAGAMLEGRIGRALLLLQRWEQAEQHFRAGLANWPDQGALHRGLATALWPQKRYQESAEAALQSVSLDYQNAQGHFLLGRALAQVGQIPRAIQAFEVCLKLNATHPRAQAWLAAIQQQQGAPARA